ANKGDLLGSKKNFKKLTKVYAENFQIIPFSTVKKIGFLSLESEIYKQLEVMRVYTKEPGKDPSPKPIILPVGAVVEELAKKLRNIFLSSFKYARIMRPHPKIPKKFTRKQVGLNYELQDRDIVQFYT
ncbi:unnamed protein product, partial [marine sediment metagenome]